MCSVKLCKVAGSRMFVRILLHAVIEMEQVVVMSIPTIRIDISDDLLKFRMVYGSPFSCRHRVASPFGFAGVSARHCVEDSVALSGKPSQSHYVLDDRPSDRGSFLRVRRCVEQKD